MAVIDWIILCVAWYVLGFFGFVFWWTKSHDLAISDILFALFVAIIGPLSWIFGFMIHGDYGTVVMKRRK